MSEYSDLEITRDNEEIFELGSDDLGKKIKPVPKPETNIGIDTRNEFYDTIIAEGEGSAIDINQINSFTQLSHSRETLYEVIDSMTEDSTIAAALETYAEDATEVNDQGRIVWCESSDTNVSKYVTFLLDSLNVDKHVYQWVYSLCKYGDIYLKLYRQSDFKDNLLQQEDKTVLNEKFSNLNDIPKEDNKEKLDESVVLKAYDAKDRLVNYVSMVPNPGEMFELTKFGKSYAYIRTNTIPTVKQQETTPLMNYYTYKMLRAEVEVSNAVSYVHGALIDDVPRIPEQIQLFQNTLNDPDSSLYTVRRGQSLLYNVYKIWRQNMLLENALLLNRLTKSSILRVVEVEVADMPKEKVRPHLQKVKSLVEQKASISDGNKMSEYTNPGAMENNVYVPTRNGVGAIQTQQIGGDVNVRDIADIDFFNRKLFAGLKIPRQFFSETNDSTGFNGGTSLSIISSRYAKTVKRIQAVMCQTITDLINILLLDRELDSYVNKFSLHMQPPVTQEELDRRDAQSSEIGITGDIMNMVADIEDPVIKLKILKSLLSQSISNTDVTDLIQKAIESLEDEQKEALKAENEDKNDSMDDMDDLNFSSDSSSFDDFDFDSFAPETNGNPSENVVNNIEDTLPSPADLNAGDFTEV